MSVVGEEAKKGAIWGAVLGAAVPLIFGLLGLALGAVFVGPPAAIILGGMISGAIEWGLLGAGIGAVMGLFKEHGNKKQCDASQKNMKCGNSAQPAMGYCKEPQQGQGKGDSSPHCDAVDKSRAKDNQRGM